MTFIKPTSAEQVFGTTEQLVHEGYSNFIVIDSVAHVVTKAELSKAMSARKKKDKKGTWFNDEITKMMSIFCRKMEKILPEKRATVILTNHLSHLFEI